MHTNEHGKAPSSYGELVGWVGLAIGFEYPRMACVGWMLSLARKLAIPCANMRLGQGRTTPKPRVYRAKHCGQSTLGSNPEKDHGSLHIV